jgi:OmpA-OmpF porin, OOP family
MRRQLFSCLAFAATVTTAAAAFAQSVPGFAVDRFNPSERGSEWFALDSLDMRGNARPAIGVVGELALKPLAIPQQGPDGTHLTVLNHQFYTHLGASMVLGDRVRIGLNVPLLLSQSGQSGTAFNQQYTGPNKAALGDVRMSADVRLVGQYGDAFILALGGQMFLNTGSASLYTGDDSARGQVHLTAAGDVGIFVYSARAGFLFHESHTTFAGQPIGDEFIYGAAAGVRVANKKLVIGPELYGSTIISTKASDQTPLEVLLGTHYTIGEDWRVGAGAGPGLSKAYGSPDLRILGSVEWVPGYHPPVAAVSDLDGDGIPDEKDACPRTPGPRSDDPQKNGCPIPSPADKDGDGILDKDDACPDDAGVKTDDPATNGCPDKDGDGIPDKTDACVDVKGVKTDDPKTNGCPPDKDGDGILDADDACVDVKGIKTDDPKTNGCPPDPDRDKDGILNDVDACPDEPGKADPDPKKNGCPKAFVQAGQIKITEQVKFKTGSAQIEGKASDEVLNAVVTVLKAHPEIKKIRVEGHTDNVGNAANNKKLSDGRAGSVVKWLIAHGVGKDTLSSQGFGQEKPIDSNATPEGRTNNRRVEFHIEGSTPPAN